MKNQQKKELTFEVILDLLFKAITAITALITMILQIIHKC